MTSRNPNLTNLAHSRRDSGIIVVGAARPPKRDEGRVGAKERYYTLLRILFFY